MRRKPIRVLARYGVPLLAAALLASCGGGHDNVPLAFSTTASGAEEVPAVASSGTAAGIVTVDPVNNTLLASVVAVGIADTNAWLQEGVPGTNGPVILALAKEAGSGAWTASATIGNAQLDALRAGRYYFNVATAAHPGGELRGQVVEQLPTSQQWQLVQPLRQQSPLIDQQLQWIERIVDDLDSRHSGVGLGLWIGF